ncbi:NAD(P)/FAD-dependent oxidoreductase [Magnetospira sp. QH-2]|uniref:NAD(P)/FAD-dependent oxidoreductase n=1 Tax=Magnetospira sp. (strain QH-2) TaxID=1288970 RepID=UPI0003E8111B|nr:FAD-dependent oxidoreductase [Magnetospira sp. QH-2]CCQ74511.1 putative ferredoxin--NAD(+) reductase [Magnetospira sp. QH-2]
MPPLGEAPGVVIVGAGQAGYQTAESLRQEGYEGSITVVGEEPHVPYQRPPLSKAYLLGETDKHRLKFRAEEYYGEHAIDMRVNMAVTAIDRAAKHVSLSDGTTLDYARLVLATGARVRTLPVPGGDLDGVLTLKTLDDVDHIERRLKTVENVVVIGAGFIGLEFAAVSRKLGKNVTVLEAAPRVMGRVVSETLSSYFEQVHRDHGVRIHCNAMVSELTGNGMVEAVLCADGTSYPADLVVVGIGVIPNVALAESAGLPCANGITVDEFCRTGDPDIYAAGDCAVYAHPFADAPLRLESVQNAADQGRTVAAAIAGNPKPYETVPWFWSDQFDLKLQMVGLQNGCDQMVIRGDREAHKFSLFHFRAGRLRAIDSINKAADHIQGRKLLAAGKSPTPEQAADESFKLNSLLK